MDSARERLAGARDAISAGHPELAVSAAYYAMLDAARAALSEHDEYAKTHSGTWTLLSERFAATGAFDQTVGFWGGLGGMSCLCFDLLLRYARWR